MWLKLTRHLTIRRFIRAVMLVRSFLSPIQMMKMRRKKSDLIRKRKTVWLRPPLIFERGSSGKSLTLMYIFSFSFLSLCIHLFSSAYRSPKVKMKSREEKLVPMTHRIPIIKKSRLRKSLPFIVTRKEIPSSSSNLVRYFSILSRILIQRWKSNYYRSSEKMEWCGTTIPPSSSSRSGIESLKKTLLSW